MAKTTHIKANQLEQTSSLINHSYRQAEIEADAARFGKFVALGEALEKLIDGNTLYDVISALDGICGDKAEHIRSNWQDERLARAWESAAASIAQVGISRSVRAVSGHGEGV